MKHDLEFMWFLAHKNRFVGSLKDSTLSSVLDHHQNLQLANVCDHSSLIPRDLYGNYDRLRIGQVPTIYARVVSCWLSVMWFYLTLRLTSLAPWFFLCLYVWVIEGGMSDGFVCQSTMEGLEIPKMPRHCIVNWPIVCTSLIPCQIRPVT